MHIRFVISTAVLTLSITSAVVPITAQPNDARPSDSQQLNTDQQRSQDRQREADNLAAIASILSRIERRQAEAEQRRADQEPTNWSERLWDAFWTSTTSNFLLAIFAAVAATIGIRTLRAIDAQTIEIQRSAKAAEESAKASADTLATNQEIERAYITMFCRDVRFLERRSIKPDRSLGDHRHPDTVDIVIDLKNVGRTPGQIVGGWCGFLYQQAADQPRLLPALDSSTHLRRLYLLPQDSKDFALQITLKKHQILFLREGEPEDGSVLVDGEDLRRKDPMCLWLAGEIDYCDRFGHFHRSGYATRWDRHANRFLWDPTVEDLNYDRSLTGEEIQTRGYLTLRAV